MMMMMMMMMTRITHFLALLGHARLRRCPPRAQSTVAERKIIPSGLRAPRYEERLLRRVSGEFTRWLKAAGERVAWRVNPELLATARDNRRPARRPRVGGYT